MLLLIGLWAALALWLIVIGRSLLAWLRIPAAGLAALFAAFWVGWCTLLAALQLWHLFLPVNWAAWAVLVPLGCAPLVWQPRLLRTLFVACGRQRPTYLAVLLLVAIWLANRALGPMQLYDAGLYHLNAVLGPQPIPSSPASKIFTPASHSTPRTSCIWHGSMSFPGCALITSDRGCCCSPPSLNALPRQ